METWNKPIASRSIPFCFSQRKDSLIYFSEKLSYFSIKTTIACKISAFVFVSIKTTKSVCYVGLSNYNLGIFFLPWDGDDTHGAKNIPLSSFMKLQMNKSKYNIRIKTVSTTTIQSYLKTIERLGNKILENLKTGYCPY